MRFGERHERGGQTAVDVLWAELVGVADSTVALLQLRHFVEFSDRLSQLTTQDLLACFLLIVRMLRLRRAMTTSTLARVDRYLNTIVIVMSFRLFDSMLLAFFDVVINVFTVPLEKLDRKSRDPC